MIVDRFGRSKQAFIDNLQCEDYEEEGILDLVQLREAISSFDEDLEETLLDYILYYVFIRSASPDRMEYSVLIKLINDGLEQSKRVQSANKKNRPESSSPEKLKLRNPDMQQKAKTLDFEEEEEKYSEEEIVQDEENAEDDYS
jgi:hypothetical protein